MSLLKGAEGPGQHQAGEFVPPLCARAAGGAQAFSQTKGAVWSGKLTRYMIHEAATDQQVPEAVASWFPVCCFSEAL